MNKNPFFSVVIPTFNQDSFLKKAINSVLQQTFKDFEIIIIDNNSTDNTEETVKYFNLENIQYEKISNGGIIAKSRNLGIKKAKGKWIAFLDSDDDWESEKLDKVYNIIKNNSADVVSTNMWIKEEGKLKRKIYKYGPFRTNFYKILIKFGNRISTSASVVKKEFLVKYNIMFSEKSEIVTTEDFDFFLNISRKNARFYFIDLPLGTHSVHQKSASSNFNKHNMALKHVLKDHVFNKQDFEPNKNKLWKEVEGNYNLRFVLQKIKIEKFNISNFYLLVKNLIKNPKNSLIFLTRLIKNKLLSY
ncbi:MAG: glycosyl transferase [Cytophagia bacterium]|nr:glycosyl transferase [Cytophagia bacterium]|tara:strand:- start:284 stop:1192 length:909 start_codon:yes stop_codon:yes gene_type:complete